MTRKEAIDILEWGRPREWDSDKDIKEFDEALGMAVESLKLIPDNATNIDVIKALFPNGSQVKGAGIFIMEDKRSNLNYDIDWGDAPYRKE